MYHWFVLRRPVSVSCTKFLKVRLLKHFQTVITYLKCRWHFLPAHGIPIECFQFPEEQTGTPALMSSHLTLPSLETLLRYMLDSHHMANYFYIHFFFIYCQLPKYCLGFSRSLFPFLPCPHRQLQQTKWHSDLHPGLWAIISKGHSVSLIAFLSNLFFTVMFLRFL